MPGIHQVALSEVIQLWMALHTIFLLRCTTSSAVYMCYMPDAKSHNVMHTVSGTVSIGRIMARNAYRCSTPSADNL